MHIRLVWLPRLALVAACNLWLAACGDDDSGDAGGRPGDAASDADGGMQGGMDGGMDGGRGPVPDASPAPDADSSDDDADAPDSCLERLDMRDRLTIGSFCRAYQRAVCLVQTRRLGVDAEHLPCDDAGIERAAGVCAAERRSAVNSGAVVFDAQAAAECVNGLLAARCAPAALDVPSCRAAFAGTLALDAACDPEAVVEACSEGLYCHPQVDECGGRCRTFEPEGTGCYMIGRRCAPGLECNQGSSNDSCQPVDSELPTLGELGDPCLEDRQCPLQATEPHTFGWWSGQSSCVAGFCRMQSYEDGPCGNAHCVDGQVCSNRRTCSLAPDKTCFFDWDCSTNEGNCPVTPGLCVAPFADGAECRHESWCASGHCLDGRCVAELHDVGEACDGAEDCKSAACLNNACITLLADDEPCTTANDCLSRVCLAGECGLRGPNESCEWMGDCVSERCEQGVCVERGGTGESCGADGACVTGICREGVCADPAAEGETCRQTSDCMLDLLCTSDGRCHAKGAGVGAPCSDHPDSCAREFRCAPDACPAFDGGRCCAAVASEGAACMQNRDCMDGLFCCDANAEESIENMPCGEDDSRTCMPPVAVGEKCFHAQHCVSGRCLPHYDEEPGECAAAVDCD
jgi:hypothetical protein